MVFRHLQPSSQKGRKKERMVFGFSCCGSRAAAASHRRRKKGRGKNLRMLVIAVLRAACSLLKPAGERRKTRRREGEKKGPTMNNTFSGARGNGCGRVRKEENPLSLVFGGDRR